MSREDEAMIRLATAGDVEAIRACSREAFSQYVAAIGKEPAPMLADFGQQVADGLVHLLEDGNGTFIGYVTFFPEADHLHLESVAVRSAFAGRGHGKRLVQFCESEAQRRGFRAVELYTNLLMSANLAIYPRLGYRETGRREEHGYSRVFYRKDLA